jgi:DNA polymerase III epsilon subunit-like protein
MYAIIDTETSGLPNYKLPADDPSQPRLAQFAVILVDRDMNELPDAERHFFVRPDGWAMEQAASDINGLTTEQLTAAGVPIGAVLDEYARIIGLDYGIIAFNARFDAKILRGEFRRAGRDDLFERTRNWCAMYAAKDFGVINARRKGFPPSLLTCCEHFGIEVEPKPHDARHGVRACLRVVRELRAGGVEPEPAVHYAKEKAEAVS